MLDSVELITALMACRPESAAIARVNQAQELMRERLSAEGLHCSMELVGERKVLFAATTPGKCQDVLLNAHLDVVPAEDAMYTPRVKGGNLYGRGAVDCFGNAVCVAKVLCALKGRASVGAIFTADEEIGGATTAAMVARGYVASKIALVLDSGAYTLVIAQKGTFALRLVARGRAGHSSRPWDYDNAIDKLIDGYLRIRQAWPAVSKDDTWHNTMAACKIQSGHASNQIPDVAEMTINFRFIADADYDAIIAMARELSGLEVEPGHPSMPLYSDDKSPALQSLLAVMQRAFPDRKIGVSKMCGATDARHMKGMGVPVGVIGVRGGGAHSAEEFVDLANLDQYVALLVEYIGGL
ncbi:MAG: M20/M25/M40 family metallo-hydrolase [Lentisphaeria bacterium]|nr:M20/M25/M40 family metallo-hydrolase [Lentisphaeria bacterium]